MKTPWASGVSHQISYGSPVSFLVERYEDLPSEAELISALEEGRMSGEKFQGVWYTFLYRARNYARNRTHDPIPGERFTMNLRGRRIVGEVVEVL